MPTDYPAYPNHKLMLKYIQSIAEKFNLAENSNYLILR